MQKYLLIIKKMLRNIFYLSFILLLFSGCQSVKDGLTGSKKSNSDEFLVEKKNPLVLPAEFDKLPEPSTVINDNKKIQEDTNIKNILTGANTDSQKISINKTSKGSLEKTLLEKIKNN